MKRIALLMVLILLLAGCGRRTDETMEHMHDTGEGISYTISVNVPEGVNCETFGENGCLYTAENGDYSIIAETVEAETLGEAVRSVSGFSSDALEIVALGNDGIGEYHFAWASCSEEGELLSRCALYAADGRYYAVTMTQASSCAAEYRDVAEAVFSGIRLETEMII